MNGAKIHLAAKIDLLKELLADIKDNDFDTFNQVHGLIHTNLELLEKLDAKYSSENELADAFFNAEVVGVRL
ncbi:hypothetical protein [Pseudoalteromonas sp.]|uniref:hypothetical protein n=1 Tax=Pseudoalteromonas sp. TaxID=53249 RepID=UPI003562CBDF